MPVNVKKLAKELDTAYKSARDAEVEDDVSLCDWVRRQTAGTELTLRQAERLRILLEAADEAPVKVLIFVEGGVVQGCTSNDKNLEVIIVDRDNLESEEDPEEVENDITEEHPECVHDVY
jgi:hypothetical protein